MRGVQDRRVHDLRRASPDLDFGTVNTVYEYWNWSVLSSGHGIGPSLAVQVRVFTIAVARRDARMRGEPLAAPDRYEDE